MQKINTIRSACLEKKENIVYYDYYEEDEVMLASRSVN